MSSELQLIGCCCAGEAIQTCEELTPPSCEESYVCHFVDLPVTLEGSGGPVILNLAPASLLLSRVGVSNSWERSEVLSIAIPDCGEEDTLIRVIVTLTCMPACPTFPATDFWRLAITAGAEEEGGDCITSACTGYFYREPLNGCAGIQGSYEWMTFAEAIDCGFTPDTDCSIGDASAEVTVSGI